MFYTPLHYISDLASITRNYLEGARNGRPRADLEREAALAMLEAQSRDVARIVAANRVGALVEMGVILIVVVGLGLLALRFYA